MKAALCCVVLLAVAGCGGSSGYDARLPAAPPSVGPTSSTTGSAKLVLTIPRATAAHARSPKYISPATTTIEVVAQSANGIALDPASNTTTIALSAANCVTTQAGETCTLIVTLPAATDVIGILTYYTDSNSIKYPLSINPSATVQIAQNATTTAPITLSGIVASATAVVTGAPSPFDAFQLTAYDFGGNVITGTAPYFNGVRFAEDGPAQSIVLAQVNAPFSSTITLVDPSHTVQLLDNDDRFVGTVNVIMSIPSFSVPPYFGTFGPFVYPSTQQFTFYCIQLLCSTTGSATIPIQ